MFLILNKQRSTQEHLHWDLFHFNISVWFDSSLCVVFQMFIHQRLSQWVLTECSTSSLWISHWAVRETLLSGEWGGFLRVAPCPVLTGGEWLDPDVTCSHHSVVMQCTGVSLDQESSATQSTSLYMVRFTTFSLCFIFSGIWSIFNISCDLIHHILEVSCWHIQRLSESLIHDSATWSVQWLSVTKQTK